jgi:hypothetical protein
VDFDGFSTPTYDNLVQSTWNPSFDFSTDVVLDCQSQIAASTTAAYVPMGRHRFCVRMSKIARVSSDLRYIFVIFSFEIACM